MRVGAALTHLCTWGQVLRGQPDAVLAWENGGSMLALGLQPGQPWVVRTTAISDG